MARPTVSLAQLTAWLSRFDELVRERLFYLTTLDAAIGDGDHGVNLSKGMSAVMSHLATVPPADVDELLKSVGMNLVSPVGGASGPLYGTFFLRFGMSAGKTTKLDAEGLGSALRAGLEGVVARGNARIGDKTLFDAMLPAVEAFTAAVADGADAATAANAAHAAAVTGRDSTLPLVASKGRAAEIGERAVGHVDPGAASTALLFEALSAALADTELRREIEVTDPDGLHARPAAQLADALAKLEARVTATNLRSGKPAVVVTGATSLLILGARFGDRIAFTASGADAARALAAVERLMSFERRGPIGVSAGRAVAPVLRMPEPLAVPARRSHDDPGAEIGRLSSAMSDVASALRERAARVPGGARDILEASAMVATDQSLLSDAAGAIASGEGAELAAWQAFSAFAEALAEQGGTMAARVADVHDLRDRVVSILLGVPAPGVPQSVKPFILVARDLAPADTAVLDRTSCVGILIERGGPTSHTAILARALGIPAIVAAAGALDIAEGTPVYLDGATGQFEANPSTALIEQVTAQALLPSFAGAAATKDGHRVQLMANVGSPESVAAAVELNAEGVGLFRTEFCFLDRAAAPTIDEQVAAYRPVFAAFTGRRVLVRTLDAGADKPLAFATVAGEENPALGMRGIRSSWRHPELLSDQLAAIAAAAETEGADVWVMAPMIATVDEANDFASQCRDHGLPIAGAMVETPAAALMAAEVLTAVDFVSIGTNDLAQYALAADRQFTDLASLNDPWQPAVLRLIAMTATAGAAASKPVGVCGEAAADPVLACVLVGLGVTSLSMTPRAIAAVAAQLASFTLADCHRAGAAAAGAATAAAARTAVLAILA